MSPTWASKRKPSLYAFCIPASGLWQFEVVPFGAMNLPAEFERLKEKVLTCLIYVTLLIYLDDIIVCGKTSDIHLQNLKEVFKRLASANLKLNPEKCDITTNCTT
ncbi:MAG: reverse transcriptase domain-containing protein [Candidatus Thiodiazotropha sp.]